METCLILGHIGKDYRFVSETLSPDIHDGSYMLWASETHPKRVEYNVDGTEPYGLCNIPTNDHLYINENSSLPSPTLNPIRTQTVTLTSPLPLRVFASLEGSSLGLITV